jgi:hypothetical protein
MTDGISLTLDNLTEIPAIRKIVERKLIAKNVAEAEAYAKAEIAQEALQDEAEVLLEQYLSGREALLDAMTEVAAIALGNLIETRQRLKELRLVQVPEALAIVASRNTDEGYDLRRRLAMIQKAAQVLGRI